MQADPFAGQIALSRRWTTIFRTLPPIALHTLADVIHRTVSRKNFTSVDTFIAEPDSRAQCAALEENVKEFGLTYFGMKDRRQGRHAQHSLGVMLIISVGIVHIIGPEQGFTVKFLISTDFA